MYSPLQCLFRAQRQTTPYNVVIVNWRDVQDALVCLLVVRDVAIGEFTARQIVEVSTLAEGCFLVVVFIHARLLPFKINNSLTCGRRFRFDVFEDAYEVFFCRIFGRFPRRRQRRSHGYNNIVRGKTQVNGQRVTGRD